MCRNLGQTFLVLRTREIKLQMTDENISKGVTTATNSNKRQNDLFSYGDHLYWKGEYDAAKEHFKKVLRTLLIDSARCHSSLGAVNAKLQHYEDALKSYQTQLDVLKDYHEQLHVLNQLEQENKTQCDIAECLMSIGTILRLQKKYAKAINYYKQALEHLDTCTPIPNLKSKVYKNIANLYAKTREFDSALEHFEKALVLDGQSQDEDHLEVGQTYADMGAMFYSKQDYKQALDYFVKARETWGKLQEQSQLYIESLQKPISTVQSKLGRYMSYSMAFANEKLVRYAEGQEVDFTCS